VNAAKQAGIKYFVHTSVSGTGNHKTFPGWSEGRWQTQYWMNKHRVEKVVRRAGFANWTILRPSYFLGKLSASPSFLPLS
jgi:nucleoside-diphosphate-sugar epimerase